MPKPDWTSGAQGAIKGGAQGYAMGGPPGAAIGAITGGAAGLFGGGRKKKRKKLTTLDERQQRLNEQQHESILGNGPLADLYNYDPKAANDVLIERQPLLLTEILKKI